MAELAREEFDAWFVGGLDMPRGQSGERIAAKLAEIGMTRVQSFATVAQAWTATLSQAEESDRIVVLVPSTPSPR